MPLFGSGLSGQRGTDPLLLPLLCLPPPVLLPFNRYSPPYSAFMANSEKCICSFGNGTNLLLKNSMNFRFLRFLWDLRPLWALGHSNTRHNLKNYTFPSLLVIPRRPSHARHPLLVILHKCEPKSRLLFPKQFHHCPYLLYYHFNLQMRSHWNGGWKNKIFPPYIFKLVSSNFVKGIIFPQMTGFSKLLLCFFSLYQFKSRKKKDILENYV